VDLEGRRSGVVRRVALGPEFEFVYIIWKRETVRRSPWKKKKIWTRGKA